MAKHRKIYSKDIPLLPLIEPPLRYMKYHVAWGKSNGVVGKVVEVNTIDKTVIMESPSTGTKWQNPVKWSDLRHLRKTQTNIELSTLK